MEKDSTVLRPMKSFGSTREETVLQYVKIFVNRSVEKLPKSQLQAREIKLLSVGGVSSFRSDIVVGCISLSNGILSDLGVKS